MKVDHSSRERTILEASDGAPGSPAPDAIKHQRVRKPNPYRYAERPGVPLLSRCPRLPRCSARPRTHSAFVCDGPRWPRAMGASPRRSVLGSSA